MILILTLALAASAMADDTSRPDLTGTWVLDESASDDVAAILKAAMGERPQGQRPGGGRGGRGGGMGGRGGGRGGSVGGGDEGERPDPSARIEALARNIKSGAERLEIFHAGDEINLTDGTGLSQLLICGKESVVWTPRGERTAVADWDGDVLRVTMKPKEGAQGRGSGGGASYALQDGILVVTRLIGSPQSENQHVIRFVYQLED